MGDAYIDHRRLNSYPHRSECRCQFLDTRLVAVEQRQVGSLPGKRFCDGAANPARCAGNADHFVPQIAPHPPERISPPVTDPILQIRDSPPEGLQPTPGPKAILSSLPRDPDLQGERLPRSSRTIHRILQQARPSVYERVGGKRA